MSHIPPDAFEYYATLGPGRGYRAVADHYGVTKRAVQACADREDWQERLQKIEAKSREESDNRLAATLDEMRERHLKVLRVISGRAVEALKLYPLGSGMEAVRAAEAAIKLERLVVGEPTERNAVSIEETIRREYQRWLQDPDDDPEDEEETEQDSAVS